MRTGCAARAAAPPTDAVCATAAEHRRPPAAHHGPRSVRPQVHRQPGLRNLLLDGGWQQPEGWSQVRTSSAVAVSSQLRVCAAAAPRFRCRCCVCARRTTCGLAGDWRARCPRTHSAPFETEIKPVNRQRFHLSRRCQVDYTDSRQQTVRLWRPEHITLSAADCGLFRRRRVVKRQGEHRSS